MVESDNKRLSGAQDSFERHVDLLRIQTALSLSLNVNGGDESANESA